MFVTGAAAVTVVVLAQRHARSSVKAEEPLSGPASDSTPRGALAEQLRANAPTPPRPLARPLARPAGFEPEPQTERGIGVAPRWSDTERGEAYDAVSSDELGAEWLARATESQPARSNASPRDDFEELTTLDLLDDYPSSVPTIEIGPHSEALPESFDIGPDSEARPESDAALGDPDPEHLARGQRARPPPHVFDIADLTQEEGTPRRTGRRS